MDAWLHLDSPCIGIEAQDTRAAMAARSVTYNGVNDRVQVHCGDIRDTSALPPAVAAMKFDLITGMMHYMPALTVVHVHCCESRWFVHAAGTPPYFPVGVGPSAADKESAACIHEYRGGVEVYCIAAAAWLRDDVADPTDSHIAASRFIVCDTSLAIERVDAAAVAAGLRVLSRLDVVPKAGKKPLFSVWAMAKVIVPVTVYENAGLPVVVDGSAAEESKHEAVGSDGKAEDAAASAEPPNPAARGEDRLSYPIAAITVRDAAGQHTPEYYDLLVQMGKLPSCRKLRQRLQWHETHSARHMPSWHTWHTRTQPSRLRVLWISQQFPCILLDKRTQHCGTVGEPWCW